MYASPELQPPKLGGVRGVALGHLEQLDSSMEEEGIRGENLECWARKA